MSIKTNLSKMKHRKATFVLRQIAAFFANGSISKEEKMALWSVLVALRGPDDKNDANKEATTQVIRYAVFGKTVIKGTSIRASADRSDLRSWRNNMERGHFKWHARKAFEAIGLKFDNREPRERAAEE